MKSNFFSILRLPEIISEPFEQCGPKHLSPEYQGPRKEASNCKCILSHISPVWLSMWPTLINAITRKPKAHHSSSLKNKKENTLILLNISTKSLLPKMLIYFAKSLSLMLMCICVSVQVTTVDRFQGQQNDYIILSLVRTKAVGHLR